MSGATGTDTIPSQPAAFQFKMWPVEPIPADQMAMQPALPPADQPVLPAADRIGIRLLDQNQNNNPAPAANQANPLKVLTGTGTTDVPVPANLLQRLNTETDAFERELTAILRPQNAGNLDGLKFRYEFSHKRVAYATNAHAEVRYLTIDNTPAHHAIQQCITALETTVEQIRGKPISRLSYNEHSLTLIGGSRSYTKIESSALARITNSPFFNAMNEALKHYLADANVLAGQHQVARDKITDATTKYNNLKHRTVAEIRTLEGLAAPTPDQKKELKALKDFDARLEKLDGYAIGHAILADVTVLQGGHEPKNCSALMDERNLIKPRIRAGCEQEEERGSRWTIVANKMSKWFSKNGPAEREQARVNSESAYGDRKLTRLLFARAYCHDEDIEKGRAQFELYTRLEGLEQPGEELEDNLIAYLADDVDVPAARIRLIPALKGLNQVEATALAARLIPNPLIP